MTTNAIKSIFSNKQLAKFLPQIAFFDLNKRGLDKLFTKKRIQLLCAIENKNPKSINKLASVVKRDTANVYRDLTILKKSGIVGFEMRGRAARPKILKPLIVVVLKSKF